MLRVFLLAIAWHVLHAVFFRIGVGEAAALSPVLAGAALRHGFAFALALATAVPLAFVRGRLRWADLESGRALRVFVLAIAFVPLWQLVSAAPNLFLGRAHGIDRALLVLLWIAIAVHPAWVGPFLAQALVVLSTLQIPLGDYLLYDLLPILDALLLVHAFAWARGFWRERASTFVVVLVALTASKYLVPGVSKAIAAWVLHEDPGNLFLASWRSGWLEGMTEDAAIRFARTLHGLRVPLLAIVQAIELSAIFVLASRRASRVVLVAFVVLHAGTCVLLGDLFWKWIWLDVALLALLGRLDAETEAAVFATRSRLASAVLLVASPILFLPQPLTWCDTGLVATFDLEAVGASGRAHAIGRADVEPFEYPFSVNEFRYLAGGKFLTGTYGSTPDCRLSEEIAKAGPRGIERLRARKGTTFADRSRAETFDRFVRRYFANRNARPGPAWWTALGPPREVWTAHRESARQRAEPVREVRVRLRETYYDGRRIHVLRDEVTRTIAIP